MNVFKRATQKVQKTVQQSIRNLPGSAQNLSTAVAAVGSFPVTTAIGTIGNTLTAAAPVLGQATQILQDNPMLGQALGSVVPGFGGLFGSPAAQTEGAVGYIPQQSQPSQSLPAWVWIVAAGAGVVAIVFFFKK